jgi:hypothetical protein
MALTAAPNGVSSLSPVNGDQVAIQFQTTLGLSGLTTSSLSDAASKTSLSAAVGLSTGLEKEQIEVLSSSLLSTTNLR